MLPKSGVTGPFVEFFNTKHPTPAAPQGVKPIVVPEEERPLSGGEADQRQATPSLPVSTEFRLPETRHSLSKRFAARSEPCPDWRVLDDACLDPPPTFVQKTPRNGGPKYGNAVGRTSHSDCEGWLDIKPL